MPYTQNKGVKLYWEAHGSGPPVVLIMGLSFTLDMWYRVLPAMSSRYRVIVFDNRGIGRSDVPKGPYSMRQMAQDCLAVMDAAGIAAAHVVGASMGGMIAQELAIRHPERVLSLLLGCTTYGAFFSRWPHFSRGPRKIKWSKEQSIERERAIAPMLYSDTTPQEHIEQDLAIRAGCGWSWRGFLNQFGAILVWNSYRRLPRITAPTLVIHGDKDYLVPPENGRVVAKRIRNSRFVLVADSGHVMVTDQPQQCLELIFGFLADHEASSDPNAGPELASSGSAVLALEKVSYSIHSSASKVSEL